MTISHGLACDFESSSPDDLGETTIFTNTTTGATPLTYSWNFGDHSEISSAENPRHTYAHVGFYTVVLTATNPCGTNVCSDAVSIEGVEGGFVSNSPVDLGDPTVFTNTTLSNPPIGEYYWTFGDGEDSEDENPVHLYGAPGTYTVTLYAVDVLYGPSSVYDIYQETVQVLAPPTLEPRSYLPVILRKE
jgi:PKD repeat protein